MSGRKPTLVVVVFVPVWIASRILTFFPFLLLSLLNVQSFAVRTCIMSTSSTLGDPTYQSLLVDTPAISAARYSNSRHPTPGWCERKENEYGRRGSKQD